MNEKYVFEYSIVSPSGSQSDDSGAIPKLPMYISCKSYDPTEDPAGKMQYKYSVEKAVKWSLKPRQLEAYQRTQTSDATRDTIPGQRVGWTIK